MKVKVFYFEGTKKVGTHPMIGIRELPPCPLVRIRKPIHMELPALKVTPKTGKEEFTEEHTHLGYNLTDFCLGINQTWEKIGQETS